MQADTIRVSYQRAMQNAHTIPDLVPEAIFEPAHGESLALRSAGAVVVERTGALVVAPEDASPAMWELVSLAQ